MVRPKQKITYVQVLALFAVTTASAVVLLANGQAPRKRDRLTSTSRQSVLSASRMLSSPSEHDVVKIDSAYGNLPLAFEPNQGQIPSSASFLSRSAHRSVFLSSNAATVVIADRDGNEEVGADKQRSGASKRPRRKTIKVLAIAMKLKGANPRAEGQGLGRLAGTGNYLLGNDPKRWRTGIPTYSRVLYRGIYPGVDIAYYGSNRELEYDFSVAPHADPRAIRIAFGGIRYLEVDPDGNLDLLTAAGEIKQLKPAIYQKEGDIKRPVSGGYRIIGKNQVGFKIGGYDRSRELVIDPIFVYSTYLGGSTSEVGKAIAVDSFGNAYITGTSLSVNFPVTTGAFQTAPAGGIDVFVTKLDPTGSSLVYSTLIGGNGDDDSASIAVDGSGNAYVAGVASGTNFPVTAGAYDISQPGEFLQRAFIAKVNPTGTDLTYSTFFGPTGQVITGTIAFVKALSVDSFGIAYFTGSIEGMLPTTADAHQGVSGGNQDAFFTKLSADGSTLIYSTYLGGTGNEVGNGIAVDSSGAAYIAGNTGSTDFPTTQGAYQTSLAGPSLNDGSSIYGDCFVTKYDSAGDLSYSTYIGGGRDETALGIAIDSSGDAYITGETLSSDFPSTPGAVRMANGGVFTSTDSGNGWVPADTGLTSFQMLTLAMDPQVHTTVYAGAVAGGICKSTDGGTHWSAINNGLTDLTVQSIAVDPGASNVIYAGAQTQGVFKTTDGGGTWIAVGSGQEGQNVTSLAIDPLVTSTVYAATTTGLFKSVDGGGTWARITPPPFTLGAEAVVIDPANHSTVYAALLGLIFKSTDGGDTWGQTGLNVPEVTQLIFDQSSSIYAATDEGVHKSTDGGTSWTFEGTGMTDLNVQGIAAAGPIVFAGTDGGLFKSTNGGATWLPSTSGLVGASVKAVAIDSVTPANVYVGSTLVGFDAFVTKLNATGTGLVYSTYLGGESGDVGSAIAVDSNGNAYVTGLTGSTHFPVTPGGPSLPDPFAYGSLPFVSKLNAAGTGLVYSTLLETRGLSSTNGIAVDGSLNAYVVGQTSNPGFPVTPGAYQTTLASPYFSPIAFNAFISRLQATPALSADLQVTETQTPAGAISGTVAYNVTITNNGPDTARNVMLIDSLPTALVETGCDETLLDPEIACEGTGNGVIGTVPRLDSGATIIFRVSAAVNCATVVDSSSAANTVVVSASTLDPIPGNNSASVSNTISNSGLISINPQSVNVPASGESLGVVNVTAPSCQWQAYSNASWIDVFEGIGSGTSFDTYSVAANSGPPRTGTATIAGKTFTVNQQGVQGQYSGNLDAAGCNVVEGWAWDATNPNTPVNVDIYDGTTLIATTSAGLYREDLLNVFGSPNHGFSFPTPASLLDGATHSVSVKLHDTTFTLPGGPRTVHCSGPGNYQGALDGVGCDAISGWAWDSTNPGGVVNVDLYDGSTFLATVTATLYRQDLQNTFGSPYHGFTFPAPASLKDGQPHTITAKFGGTSTNLTWNNPQSFTCTGASPNYQGSQDAANCSTISGYAWDTNNDRCTIDVAIYKDGAFQVVVPAQQARAGVGNGYHGFIFAIPASWKDGNQHSIMVKISGTNIVLSNSPRTLTCP